MKELILSRHNAHNIATHNRNESSRPIAGIWATPGIQGELAGYLPFGEGIPSDHRCLWVDIPTEALLGAHLPAETPRVRRKLNTSDPALVDRYNTLLLRKLTNTKCFRALKRLAAVPSAQWNETHTVEFGRIHGLQQSIRLNIERQLRKTKVGNIPWSPKLQEFRDNIELWTCILRKRQGRKMSNRKIRRLIDKLQPPSNPYHADLVQATTLL